MRDNTSVSEYFQRISLASLVYRLGMHFVRFLRTSLRAQQAAPISVLIDGDNISADLIGPILIEAGKFGAVTVKRVYGNWAQPSMQRWKEVSPYYGLEQIYPQEVNSSHKNAADIALVVDAMDMFHRDAFDRFCIVTSDSDFTPLVHRLRSTNCIVIGIGRSITPLSFTKACTTFLTTEQLVPPAHIAKTPQSGPFQPSEKSSSDATEGAATDTQLIDLLIQAYERCRKGKEEEWVLISQLGISLRKIDPDFEVSNYKQKDLSSLIKVYKDRFELRQRLNGHPEMRML